MIFMGPRQLARIDDIGGWRMMENNVKGFAISLEDDEERRDV
jgi:hypothetical protein